MIRELYRYPVKGMSAQGVEQMQLSLEHGLAGDRCIAIGRKPGVLNPDEPEARAKSFFLMLMRDEKLALLDTYFDKESNRWTIRKDGETLIDADLAQPNDVQRVEAFFAEYLADAKLDPELIQTEDHKFTDISVVSEEKARAVSLINLNSVKALGEAIRETVDPMRFRANIYFDGVPAWEEFQWLDKNLEIGSCTLEVVMRTRRCAATQVNPKTGERDINVPAKLKEHFGHTDLGIYAEVISSGTIKIGDQIVI